MDSSFAITGKGYVIVAADMTASRSIVKMHSNEDKIKILGSHLLMAFSGEPGDTVQFAEYVERNIRLAQIRNPTPFHPPLPPPGFAVSLRTLCVPDHLTP